MSKVQVEVVNQVRLVAAILAASEWPVYEQEQRGAHAVHPHAKATRHYASDYDDHPAGAFINTTLQNNTLNLADLFSTALRCNWPMFDPQEALPSAYTELPEHLADFYVDSAVAAFFWADHEALWAEAVADLKRIFATNQLADFLGKLAGDTLEQDIIVSPNLVYPALTPVVATTAGAIYLILPPPKAVGESPPWPYRDGADWVLAESCYQLLEQVLPTDLTAEQHTYLRHAATVVFLEQTQDEAAALFYMVRQQKENKLTDLPAIVEKVRNHVQNPTDALATIFA